MLYKMLVLIILSFFSCNRNGTKTHQPTNINIDVFEARHQSDLLIVISKVDEPPKFKLGDIDSFILANLDYPDPLIDVQGTVDVSFILTKKGEISEMEILKPLCPKCDSSAIKCLRMMTDWDSGKIDGHEVDTEINVSFPFLIK